MAVTTTFTVQFGDSSTTGPVYHLSAEVDGRPDGLNKGVTRKAAGESIWFLVYRSDNVTVSSSNIGTSAGTVSSGQSGLTVIKEQDVLFANEQEASLQVPARSIQSTTWLGRSLGTLSLQENGTKVRASGTGIGMARIRYVVRNAASYRLQSPATLAGLTDFPIAVVIVGTPS